MTKEQEIILKINELNFLLTGEAKEKYSSALQEVLSMLKEKDKLINEQLKENIKLQEELNEENKRCMILANNDKFKEQVIDLMAEEIEKEDIEFTEYCEFKIVCDRNCKHCIEQYFERKAKE